MSTAPVTAPATTTASPGADVARRTGVLTSSILVAGGVVFFAGGGMHPHEDPPDVTLKQHLLVMFRDPGWYPAHLVILAGMAITALGLVALVRGGGLDGVPRVRRVAVVAAAAACVSTPAMLLHLVAAVDADRIAAHRATPITDVTLVIETVTTPFFGLAMAALAVVGAATRTLGNPVTALICVLGGVGFALAGSTFLVTDLFDPLFPAASGIAVWTAAAGAGLLLRRLRLRHSHAATAGS
jgi:hypothetical protein